MKFLFLIGASCLTSCLWSYPSVRSDFPGGNGRLEGVDEGSRTLTVRKEPKGSGAGRHYYFCFEVSGLEGKWKVRVVDAPSLTRMGPAVSTDGGETWRFLFDRPVPPPGVETFEYDFPQGGRPVRFCVSIPYGEREWAAFVARHAGNPAAKLGELCKDRSGRSVERLDIPNVNGKPAWTFLFTARHHASEVSASAVLEGILDEALSDTPEGRWVRANGQVIAVPFMDKDGVVAGDQGKRRLPHDHNRDYVQEVYPSVKALKRLARDAPGRVYHVDLHSPSLKGKEHDHVYAICPEGARHDARWRAFSRAFEAATEGAALKYDPQWNIPFGHFWNNDRLFSGDGTVQQSNRWFSRLPNCHLSFCLESGYGLCGGVYSRDAARELGRNALKAIVRSVWQAPADDGIAQVTPKVTDEILSNPGMGMFHFFYSGRLWAYGAEQEPGDVLDWMPGTTLAYLRLPWSYIEPQEGIFRWDLLDGRMQPWIRAGKKVGIRISIMNISVDSTPQWVRDAGAKGHDYLYSANSTPCWEPEWDDPVLLAKLERFYAAFAARYDGNDDVAFVDVGSFGLFGEGHSRTLSRLRDERPDEFMRIAKLHIDLLRKAMPKTYLVISDDMGGGGWLKDKAGRPLSDHPVFAYCRSLGIGLRDDSILCSKEHPWLSDGFGRKFAETTPVILETGQITRRLEKNAWFPEKLLPCVEAYHASYLGVHGFPDLVWELDRHVWRETANRLGYRFELRDVKYPRVVRTDERVTIDSTWVNVGVAPCYAGGAVTWNLLDEKGVVCWRSTDETFDFRDLKPKWDGVEHPVTLASSCTFGCTAAVPDNGNDMILNWCRRNRRNDPGKFVSLLRPGAYTLAVSVGRRNGTAEIALPLENGNERIYPIGKIVVEDRNE